MAILTIEKLQDINASMLGLGAPVEIDGQGYNKEIGRASCRERV